MGLDIATSLEDVLFRILFVGFAFLQQQRQQRITMVMMICQQHIKVVMYYLLQI